MSNINDYIKPTDYGHVRKDINKILSLIHDFVAQNPEDLGNKERIMFTPHVKLRTSNVTVGGATWSETDVLSRDNFATRKKIPASVYAYDLVHATTGTLTFPTNGTWLGARAEFDGSSYITVTDHTDFDFTNEVTICMRLLLPASAGGFVVFEKANEYRIRVVDTNTLEFAVYSGGAYKTPVTFAYTPSTKYDIVCTYKSTASGQKIYINGSLSDSDSETGAINNSTGDLCIGATAGGTNISKNGTAIAFVGLLNKEVSSTWVTNYGNGLFDTSDGNTEITMINMIGNENPTPEAEAGLFKA